MIRQYRCNTKMRHIFFRPSRSSPRLYRPTVLQYCHHRSGVSKGDSEVRTTSVFQKKEGWSVRRSYNTYSTLHLHMHAGYKHWPKWREEPLDTPTLWPVFTDTSNRPFLLSPTTTKRQQKYTKQPKMALQDTRNKTPNIMMTLQID
jgi:hypothetical protein